jgi:SAM-dependent methyltransferase
MDACGNDEIVREQQALYASRNPTRRWLHCSRRDWIASALEEIVQENTGAALEVGPGSGVYLPRLSALFQTVVAADIERPYLDHLGPLVQRYGNVRLIEDDITRSRLASESFDLVLCTEVLEHIRDSPAALRGINRLLKPQGILVVTTPQRFSVLEMAMKVAYLPGVINVVGRIYREPVLDSGHINLMTAATMRAQLADAGFFIEREHRSGLYVPLVAEFGGEGGLRLQKALERRIEGTAMKWALWTQSYVARKVA